jgi:hypothetical protein
MSPASNMPRVLFEFLSVPAVMLYIALIQAGVIAVPQLSVAAVRKVSNGSQVQKKPYLDLPEFSREHQQALLS